MLRRLLLLAVSAGVFVALGSGCASEKTADPKIKGDMKLELKERDTPGAPGGGGGGNQGAKGGAAPVSQ